ncbi:MAG TPA: hypothetical protein VFK13_13530 [Gemmatimonadaceae bacterium]|jgi:hypothetical protein|nr:hypothetical protein [Gemmatimonadaceae bacterium]
MLEQDLHLEVRRKLQNSVHVKIFAYRKGRTRDPANRVCLGSLHMPEGYFHGMRRVLEHGLRLLGARVTVGGSYFDASAPTDRLPPAVSA